MMQGGKRDLVRVMLLLLLVVARKCIKQFIAQEEIEVKRG